jgi:hypothetical protein
MRGFIGFLGLFLKLANDPLTRCVLAKFSPGATLVIKLDLAGHGRGHRFDPCRTHHQINGLAARTPSFMSRSYRIATNNCPWLLSARTISDFHKFRCWHAERVLPCSTNAGVAAHWQPPGVYGQAPTPMPACFQGPV